MNSFFSSFYILSSSKKSVHDIHNNDVIEKKNVFERYKYELSITFLGIMFKFKMQSITITSIFNRISYFIN